MLRRFYVLLIFFSMVPNTVFAIYANLSGYHLDSAGKILKFCKPYAILLNDLNKNKIRGFLTYKKWFLNNNDYILEENISSNIDKKSIVLLEPSNNKYFCNDNSSIESKDASDIKGYTEYVTKIQNVYIKFLNPSFKNYGYLTTTKFDYYYLSNKKNAKSFNLQELRFSVACDLWCYFEQKNKFEIIFSSIDLNDYKRKISIYE